MRIRLVVGRAKAVEIIEISDHEVGIDYIAGLLYDRSLPHLRSHDVEATWDPETKTGKVYAGFHLVGEAVVISNADDTPPFESPEPKSVLDVDDGRGDA